MPREKNHKNNTMMMRNNDILSSSILKHIYKIMFYIMFIHNFFLYIKKTPHPNPWTALHLKKNMPELEVGKI